jgi:arylsulfatase A-like enzyme
MQKQKPNIILITTDQQRFDTIGARAPSFLHTPHLDFLSRQGTFFNHAYTDCPICVPARVSIMTGKTVLKHGMGVNGKTQEVVGRTNTLPALLHSAGYQTAAIGKMHFDPQRMRHGFDEMIIPEDYYKEMERSGYPLKPMRHGLGQNELYPALSTVPEPLTLTSWISDQCLRYILERRDPTVPFFLWASYSKPHPPLDPPEPYYSMYRNSDIPQPVYGDWSCAERCPEPVKRHREKWSSDLLSGEAIRDARAVYYGLVTHIDYSIGRIFSALQDKDELNDTVIVFTSDHGEYLGDHHASGKFFFHEPSAHIPFILKMPMGNPYSPAGTVSSAPVTLADILPTLLACAGGDIPLDCDGKNLLPLLKKVNTKIDKAQPRMIDSLSKINGQEYAAITDGRFKYIYYPEGRAEQFFDLKEDPYECRDLSDTQISIDKRKILKVELLRRHREAGSTFVDDKGFLSGKIEKEDTRLRRSRPWPGFHTEYHNKDVRH